ncbi:MAG TPA: AAA family ATPase, partial [Nitrolancea sp.]|nr:AAA family ATPase [Nitrolancea sp.]
MAEPISSTFSGRTLPRLAGRDREQAVLRDRLSATLAGHGSLVLVGGEAGIGKTTLAEALCAEATSQGALVLVGHCYDLTETPPYGPWAEALAAVPRDAASPPTPDLAGENQATGREALFAAVRDYLAARSTDQALVLLLEDLHWADPASLDLLRAVARGVTGVPLLCVATYRSDELTRRHPLYQLLPVLVREARATRLDVRPLDAASLRLLVRHYRLPERDEARLTGYLVERAEGNPFFAGELLRTLEEEGALRPDGDAWHLGDLAAIGVPSLLRQVIDARLDRLSGDGRVLLAAGAIVGQEVSLALWQVTSGADDETLATVMEAAQAAHLLVPTADGARFAHALIREALYEGTLPLRRRAWHLRCAEALLAAPAPDPDAVAHHLQRAGDPRAAEWLVRAGLRARGAVAWLTAAERFAGAAALLAGDASRARG